MGAFFHNPSFLHDDDLIGLSDSGQAVGNDDSCAVPEELVQCILKQLFAV